MSWRTINRILGLAAVDDSFWSALQKNPLAAVEAQGFELTVEEKEIFRRIIAHDLSTFSQYLLEQLAPGPQLGRNAENK
jgi:hypothetical protein